MLALLIDVSGSMGQNVRQEGKTIETFLEKRATESRVAVLSFNERLQVLQDFTSDRSLTQAVPKKAYLTSGGTYIYLSVAGAIEWLNAYAMTPGRRWAKILVVISDGFDNRSAVDHRAAIEVALRSNVKIFTVVVPLLNQFHMLAAPGSAFIELCIKTSVKPLESRAKSGKKSERMTLTGLLMAPVALLLSGAVTIGYLNGIRVSYQPQVLRWLESSFPLLVSSLRNLPSCSQSESISTIRCVHNAMTDLRGENLWTGRGSVITHLLRREELS